MKESLDLPAVRKKRLQQLLLDTFYSARVLNNSHRGDLVEIMVQEALGTEWKHVGLGWNLWDLQRGAGPDRIRIQVRHCAFKQLWGATKVPVFQFSWKQGPPMYFFRDHPDEQVEKEGWFCDMFVVGLHRRDDETCDQMDMDQWEFSVIPASDLRRGQHSISLSKGVTKWPPVRWGGLRKEVEKVIARMARSSK